LLATILEHDMRIRTCLLAAAAVAATPVLGMAQTASPPDAAPPAASTPSTAPDGGRHDRALHRHAELRQKYAQLSAADKTRFDQLTQQIRQLRREQRQILGSGSKS
jgi:Spy/CpxP family protein refolding chaperone